MTPESSSKNQNLEPSSPVYNRELPPYPADDEISLVDLVLVILRRKLLVLSIFLICISVAVAYTLTLKKHHNYTSHISIGSYAADGELVPIDLPENLLAKIKHSFIPKIQSNSSTNFSLTASIVHKSNVIALVASADQDLGKSMIRALNDLNRLIIEDHNRLYTTLMQAPPESVIPGLQNTYVLTEPGYSGAAYSKNRTLIIIASIFAGLFLGVFAAFLAEFTTRVRTELHSAD